jgi:general secretion pathway protein A
VVIERLDDQGARLALAGAVHEVELAELANHWYGEFLVVWRPSQPVVKDLRLGMRGEDVRWLRQSLAQVGGLPADAAAGDTFDGEVERLVQDFQRARRLVVDGIAGVQTQLLLDSAVGAPGTPTLAGGGGGA